MNVGVFVPSAPADHVAALQAFAEGLKACGVGHFVTGMAPGPALFILVPLSARAIKAQCRQGRPFVEKVSGSCLRRRRRADDAVPLYPRGRIIEAQCRQGRPFLVLEKGFVKRDDYFHLETAARTSSIWKAHRIVGRSSQFHSYPGARKASMSSSADRCRGTRAYNTMITSPGARGPSRRSVASRTVRYVSGRIRKWLAGWITGYVAWSYRRGRWRTTWIMPGRS